MRKEIKLTGQECIFCLVFVAVVSYIIRNSPHDYYNYISLVGVFLLTILVLIRQHRVWSAKYLGVAGGILFFFAIMFTLIIFTSNSLILDLKYLGVLMTCFTPILIYQFVDQNMERDKKSVILKVCLYVWMYYCVKAIIFYLLHNNAARHLAANPDYYGNIAIGGGYFLAYGSAILAVYLFERICDKQVNFFSVTFFLLCMAVVVLTSSSITTLAMVAGIGLVILKHFVNKYKNNVMACFVIIVILGGLFYFSGAYNLLLNRIYNIFISIQEPYAWRIIEIIDFLLGKGVAEDGAIWLRWNVYKISIETFKENPIWGQLTTQSSLFASNKIGGHSEVLDSLAHWGLFVGGGYLSIYFFAIKSVWRNMKYKTYIAVFAINMLLNPVRVFHTMFAMFFLIPLYERISE